MNGKNYKDYLKLGLKLCFAIGLLLFLIKSGKLDSNGFSLLFTHRGIFAANLAYWLLFPVILCSIRWRELLLGMGLFQPLKQIIPLNLIGYFFNSAMPGAIGGDVIKAIYILRDQPHISKALPLLTIFLDRLMGLFALFSIGFFGVISHWSQVMAIPALKHVAYFILLVFIGVLSFFFFVFVPGALILRFSLFRAVRLILDRIPGLKSIYMGIRNYRHSPRNLVKAFLASLLIQLAAMIFYMYVTYVLTGVDLPFGTAATILPIGLLTVALPIAPGGLGVGHLAFDRLYALSGLDGGANIFNTIFLGQLMLNLCGVIPYLFIRRKSSIAKDFAKKIESSP